MFVRTSLAAAILCTAASGAYAQTASCPTGPAFDGVYVEFADRTVLYRALQSGGTAEMELYFDGAAPTEYRLNALGLILESWELVDGRIPSGDLETVTFTGPPMPSPTAGATWSGQEMSAFANGDIDRYTVNLRVMSQTVLSIGGCSYPMLPVEVARTESDGSTVPLDLMGHFPTLGVTMFLGNPDFSTSTPVDPPLRISSRPPIVGGAVTAPAAPAAPSAPPTK